MLNKNCFEMLIYIKDGNIFMLHQLKIKNGLNRKLTLKYNPEPDRTNRYGFEKKTYRKYTNIFH